MFRFTSLLVALVWATASVAQGAPSAPYAKNIILMIGDGMGYNHVDSASIYQYGETGKQVYEQFKTYGMATYAERGSYDPELAWSNFQYLKMNANDSAATATTLASGEITYRGAIGMGRDRRPVRLITHVFQDRDKATGVVSDVLFYHATPASFLAHQPMRNMYHEISIDMLNSDADLIIGAGHPYYDKDGKRIDPESGEGAPAAPATPEEDDPYKRIGGRELWESLRAGTLGEDNAKGPWQLLESKDDLLGLKHGDITGRIFGLIPVATTVQVERSGDPEALPFETPFIETVPTLVDISLGSLNVLRRNPKGFFLTIEGGAVDWASHANVYNRMIEEQIAFNRAVEAVVDWIEEHSNWDETLLIVTADHECGYLTGPGSDPEIKPLENRGKGVPPGMEWHSTGHTNKLVPLYVKGAGMDLFEQYIEGEDPVRGPYVHNSAVGKVMFTLQGETPR